MSHCALNPHSLTHPHLTASKISTLFFRFMQSIIIWIFNSFCISIWIVMFQAATGSKWSRRINSHWDCCKVNCDWTVDKSTLIGRLWSQLWLYCCEVICDWDCCEVNSDWTVMKSTLIGLLWSQLWLEFCEVNCDWDYCEVNCDWIFWKEGFEFK